MNAYAVYLIKSPNGKCYVGISKKPEERLHYHATHKKSAISSAIRKYGINNMEFKILEFGLTRWMARLQEQFWIKKLNTIAPFGYNLTTGGETGKTHSQIVRDKISKSRTGQRMTEETKQKIAVTLTGRVFSKEHRLKLSNALKGKKFSEEHRKNLSIVRQGQGKGRKVVFTEQHKRNIGLSSRGRKWSEEARTRFSASRTGKKRGPYRKATSASAVSACT